MIFFLGQLRTISANASRLAQPYAAVEVTVVVRNVFEHSRKIFQKSDVVARDVSFRFCFLPKNMFDILARTIHPPPLSPITRDRYWIKKRFLCGIFLS